MRSYFSTKCAPSITILVPKPFHDSLRSSQISVGVDVGGEVIGKLQRQFRVDTVPHCYVVKNGVVEWDGHPSSLESTLALMIGFWEN